MSDDFDANLHANLRGMLIKRGDAGYEDARKLYNGMIDKRPLLIARCFDVADVITAVNFGRDNHLPIAIRGGGHNGPGLASVDDGLVIDLSTMRGVRVDPDARTARVGAGCTQGDVDHATHAFGLAVPAGIISTTGIAGLTLSGGHGYLSRKYGLTIDNLIEADVVLADGSFVTASNDKNADLFWALRGGGGNFGVVTSFVFELHKLAPQVLTGLVVHSLADATALLPQYRRAIASAPDELTCWVVMRKAPPLPFIPAEWHGREVLILAMCFIGDTGGEKALAPLRALGKPIAEYVGPGPFVAWQAAFDGLLTPGARNYWKSH